MVGTIKRTFTDELDDPYADAESLNILEGPQVLEISTIELKISEAGEALDRIVKTVERKCPEVTFYSELRSMTQLTGAGATSILGDVTRKARMVSAGYDVQLTKLCQMTVAIAGMRLAEGEEGGPSRPRTSRNSPG